MASTTNPLKLSSSIANAGEPRPDPFLVFNNSSCITQTPNLPYDTASIEGKTFFILYQNPNYNQDADPAEATIVKIIPCPQNNTLPSGCDGPFEKTYPEFEETGIASAQGFDIVNPGVILFPKGNFEGTGILYQADQKSLGDDGLSFGSAISTGGTWNLWFQKNFKGQKRTVNSMEIISNLSDSSQGVQNFHSIEYFSLNDENNGTNKKCSLQ